jgi:anti-anti-sigma factor
MELISRKIGEFYIVDTHSDIFKREFVNDLKNTVSELIEDDVKNILVNLAEVQKIDGVGLGVLLCVQKLGLFHGINIKFFGLQPYVAQMMFQTRLNRVLNICRLEDEYFCEDALRDDILVA